MTTILPAHRAGDVNPGPTSEPGCAPSLTVEPAPGAEAARASWLFAVALDLVTAGAEIDAAVRAVLGQAGAASPARALAGAYGRAVAFCAEYPDDRRARRTVEVLAKALSHHHRHRAPAPPV